MKSRHTWQRLSLGWKVSNELRVNWKASLFSAFGSKRPTDANQLEGGNNNLFILVFLSASARGSVPASARGSVCLASARGIVVSLHLTFSMHARLLFLSVPWLVDARIPHVIISHLSGSLTMSLLHGSANQKHVPSCLISTISSERHECHPADRYIHSGTGADRSAALFC